MWLFDSSRNKIASKVVHGTTIELVWTIVPSLILVTIAVPSFALLYSIDPVISFLITTYLITKEDFELTQLRFLEVNNRVILQINTHMRILIISTDVIHA